MRWDRRRQRFLITITSEPPAAGTARSSKSLPNPSITPAWTIDVAGHTVNINQKGKLYVQPGAASSGGGRCGSAGVTSRRLRLDRRSNAA
jgi:hypothetical protein